MLPLSALGFIRFDVEDFLTAESDRALAVMLESMQRWGLPGSYGIVGKKALALRERRADAAIQALRLQPAIGFHSWSHSEHPTLAEELSALDYPNAVARFVERERPGVDAVRDLVKAPQYFTQPGGNWVPEAVEALPALGMDCYFTDSFNSYVEDLTGPYWFGPVLHLSFPVVNPRPFGLGLPQNLDEAVSLVESWRDRAGEAFMVMLHPTELVTHEFWDAVNFSRGATDYPLKPAPVRTAAEQEAALSAFDAYCERVSRLDVEWCDTASLREKLAPRGPVEVGRKELERAIAVQGWGPLELTQGTLSAAEALYALSRFTVKSPDLCRVPYVGAPEFWRPAGTERAPGVSDDRLKTFAGGVVDAVERTGRLPSGRIAGLTLEEGMTALVVSPITFLNYIKPQERLHWDWPIFPDRFRPVRLWEDARRLAWTLKRARYRTE